MSSKVRMRVTVAFLPGICHGSDSFPNGTDLVEARLEKLLTKASSVILSNITFDSFDNLDDLEVRLLCFAFKFVKMARNL